jgi:hypothetical protein
MRVKSYMIYSIKEWLEGIDEGSLQIFDVSRQVFEERIKNTAIDPDEPMILIKDKLNPQILILKGKSDQLGSFAYEFESALAAELILQLFNTERRKARKERK